MNRRKFCTTSGLLGMALAVTRALPAAATGQAAPVARGLTTIAYNILACRGYPETDDNRGRLQAAHEQMVERLAHELALYHPDIITFSESPAESVVAGIAAELKMNYAWFPGGWPGNDDYPGGFPGTILSLYPIAAPENCPLADGGPRPEDLFTRHWCRAIVEMPGGSLPVFSAHLHPSDAAVREREVTEILRVVAPYVEAGQSFLLQGDLNHRPDGPEYPRWQQAGLVDTFQPAEGRPALTVPSTVPRGRIDYIWAHGPLAQTLTEGRVLFEGSFRTNPDDPASFALSDHLPVIARYGEPSHA